MAVTLIDGGVSRQEVIVLLAVYVPDMHTLAAGQHHRDWCIVVGSIAVLAVNELWQNCTVSTRSLGTTGVDQTRTWLVVISTDKHLLHMILYKCSNTGGIQGAIHPHMVDQIQYSWFLRLDVVYVFSPGQPEYLLLFC